MKIKRLRILQQLKFLLERQLIKGAPYQLLFVASVIGLISITGGLLVNQLNGGRDLGESIWWAFLRLTDPGYLGDDEGAWIRFISTIITIAGYVLFLGSLVAIITTSLNRKIRDLERGLTPVAANNHIVILGWTNRTVHVAGELLQSKERVRRFLKLNKTRILKLIILTEEVSPLLLTELKENRNIGKKANKIVLRSGTSIDREHLRRVDIINASTIIIPSYPSGTDELITPDVETLKTLLSINAETENSIRRRPLIVAEIQDENKIKAANRAYDGPMEVIASDTLISRLIAQNIRHSGLTEIYNEILARSIKTDLFTRQFPGLVNKKWEEVKPFFPKCVLIGVVQKQNDALIPMLNLDGEYVLKKEDTIILLANEFNETEPAIASVETKSKSASMAHKTLRKSKHQKIHKKILILGWNYRVPALINEFGSYEGETYHIDIASLRAIPLRKKALEIIKKPVTDITIHQIEADYVREAELVKIQPDQYDNIIFVSTDKLEEEEEADARTIAGYILLEELLSNYQNQPNILVELADPNNESMIKRFNRDVIVSPMIISHILAQIAIQKELHSIYDALFSIGGTEISFRDLSDYGIESDHISFREIESFAAEYNETALGFYSDSQVLNDHDFHFLNPPRDFMIDVNSEIKVIILFNVN